MKEIRNDNILKNWFEKRFSAKSATATRLYYVNCVQSVIFSAWMLFAVLPITENVLHIVTNLLFAICNSVVAIYKLFGTYSYKYEVASILLQTMLIFPAIFMTTGGVKGGALFLFVYGISLMTLIIKKPMSYYCLITLFIEYVGIIVIAFKNPQFVYGEALYGNANNIIWLFLIIGIMFFVVLRLVVTGYNKEHKQLRILNNKLNTELITDDLTEIYNHRHIKAEIIRAIDEANEHSRIYLCMYDMDDFKEVNDEYGHMIGNDVLFNFAQMMKQELGGDGVCSRYGGEEFMVLIEDKSPEEVLEIAERIRKRAEKELFVTNTERIVTVSCGIAQYQPGEDAEAFAQSVDDRMYKAKHQGKNQTVFF